MQISFTVTAKLISAIVFAIRIVQSLCYLHPKFQASSHLLWLYRRVYVGPGRETPKTGFLTTRLICYLESEIERFWSACAAVLWQIAFIFPYADSRVIMMRLIKIITFENKSFIKYMYMYIQNQYARVQGRQSVRPWIKDILFCSPLTWRKFCETFFWLKSP